MENEDLQSTNLSQENLDTLNEFKDKAEMDSMMLLELPEKKCGSCEFFGRCAIFNIVNDRVVKANVYNGVVGTDQAIPLRDENWDCGSHVFKEANNDKVETVEFAP